MIAPAGYRRLDIARIVDRWQSEGDDVASLTSHPTRILPLSDAAYFVLLALACPAPAASPDDGLTKALEESTNLQRLAPGTLRKTLARLVEQRLLRELPREPESPGERRYRVTPLGDAVLYAEAGRRRRRPGPSSFPAVWTFTASPRAESRD